MAGSFCQGGPFTAQLGAVLRDTRLSLGIS